MYLFQRNSAKFDGNAPNYLDFNTSSVESNIIGTDGSFSVCVWFKGDLSSQRSDLNIYTVGLDDKFSMRVAANNSDPSFGCWYRDKNGVTNTYVSDSNFLDGVWHHSCVIVNIPQNKVYVYVDGLPDGEYNLSNSVIATPINHIYIGAHTSTYGYFTGNIGEVRVYNRPLHENEVRYLHNMGHIRQGLTFWVYFDDYFMVYEQDSDGVNRIVYVSDVVNSVGAGNQSINFSSPSLDVGASIELNKHLVLVKEV